jgi:uncharacterized protein YkwD
MKIWRSLRTAAAAAAFCFVFFHCPAYSQDRSPNRPPSPTRPIASHPSAEEKLLFDAANRERAAAGLQALRWDSALAAAARQHAQVMVNQNLLLHQCPGEPPLDERAAQAGARFSLIAENIAVGPNPASIHDGWMHSPGHRKNILSAEVSAVGIAAMRGKDGLFAVQDFSRPVEVLSLEEQEEKVILLLKATHLQSVETSEDARRTCGMDHGFAGAAILYVIRFEVTDLNKLPDELLKKINSRQYRKAAVGACGGGEIANFTRYRLAVLLD